MDTTTLIRSARPAALAAAVLGVPADLYHFPLDSRAEAAGSFLFYAHGAGLVAAWILALVALLGLALRLGADRWASVSVPMAFVGTVLVIADIYTEAFWMPLAPEQLSDPTGVTLTMIVLSFGLFAVGWLVTALRLGARRLVPRGVAVVMALGAVYGFTPFPGSYILLLVGLAAAAVAADREPAARVPVSA
jgi:hypothetical protein